MMFKETSTITNTVNRSNPTQGVKELIMRVGVSSRPPATWIRRARRANRANNYYQCPARKSAINQRPDNGDVEPRDAHRKLAIRRFVATFRQFYYMS